MENLFKQLRTKYPNVGEEGKEVSSTTTKDKTIPPQRTQSFKGEKRRTQSWIKRQFSGSMGRDSDSINEGEYQLAVGAAAFAIKSFEESRDRDGRRGSRIPDAPSTKIKSKTEETAAPAPDRRTKSTKFSDEVAKPSLDVPDQRVHITKEAMEKMPETAVIPPAPAIKKKLSFADTHQNNTASSLPEGAVPAEKAAVTAPAIKKTSTFDKSLARIRGRKSEIEEGKQEIPAPIRPPFLPDDIVSQSTKIPGKGDVDAEAWEKAEMARIKEKYDKLKTTILDWEQKKKTKAKRRLERIEAELDKKRAKAMKHHRSELVRIESIAGGARSQAAENRKNEEFKVKEKASKIRLTGKLPATCWCF